MGRIGAQEVIQSESGETGQENLIRPYKHGETSIVLPGYVFTQVNRVLSYEVLGFLVGNSLVPNLGQISGSHKVHRFP